VLTFSQTLYKYGVNILQTLFDAEKIIYRDILLKINQPATCFDFPICWLTKCGIVIFNILVSAFFLLTISIVPCEANAI